MDRKEIQEFKQKIEELQDIKKSGYQSNEAKEVTEQEGSRISKKQIEEQRHLATNEMQSNLEPQEQEENNQLIHTELANNRELAIRNELCHLRERLNDLEVREVEMSQRLEKCSKIATQEYVYKKEKQIQEQRFDKQQQRFNEKLLKIREEIDLKLKEFESKIVLVSDSQGVISSVQDDGLGRLLRIINSKAGADDVRQFILSNEFKLEKINDKLRFLSFQVQKNSKMNQNIVGVIKGVGGGGQFNNILLSTKGLHCLSCGRNEYGKVILNNPPRGYTHGSPFRSAHRTYQEGRGVQISPHLPRTNNEGEGSFHHSARSKSPDFLNRSNKLLVGSAKLSLEEYMNKTAELFNKRENQPHHHHSQPSETYAASLRSSVESPQLQGKHQSRVQTQQSRMNEIIFLKKEMNPKSPFAQEKERLYFYQSPSVRSSTPS